MPPGFKTERKLDRERCWKEWMRLDSLNKVSLLFEKEGLFNERTGRRFTWAAIEKAAFRWVLENKEEARRDLRQWWMNSGKILDEESWKKFLAGIIRTTHSSSGKKRYTKELERHGLETYSIYR